MDEKSLEYEEISKMFRKRMRSELGEGLDEEEKSTETKVYADFKQQYLPKHLSLYEKFCAYAEKILPVKPQENNVLNIQENINTCHLNVTPTGVNSAALLLPLLIIFLSMLFFYIMPVLSGGEGNLFFVMFFLIVAAILYFPLQALPKTFANQWRMKASNQLVLSVFYVVTYMRHTSNLERAINFAAEHLGPPLSLDFRKIVWDVETQKHQSIKESLDIYLDGWRNHNMEYVESMSLIQSSLLEASEERRVGALDKSLSVILDETYEKMLRYAHNLQSPLTTLNMLGVVLPILTLVILPLLVALMDVFDWYHLFAIYNIALPALVFYLGLSILSNRPGGSGQIDVLAKNPELKKLQNINIKVSDTQTISISPLYFSLIIGLIIVLIGFIPLISHQLNPNFDFALVDDGDTTSFRMIDQFTDTLSIKASFLEYKEKGTDVVGPFGVIATLLSLAIPFGVAYSVSTYNKLRTKNIIKIRDEAKKLELEFSSALFQFGNRLGDGIPAEIAFGRVGSQLSNTISGKFFLKVHLNITSQGMSVEKAIFDKKIGALRDYPSEIIESSMKVLVESSKKGPLIASKALINVAEYIREMHRIDEKLNDLMAETVTDMHSQMIFLTPVISAVVVAITSLITKIMGTLSSKMQELGGGGIGGDAPVPGVASILTMFGIGIPTYYFTLVVGLYVVELAFILSIISSGIESGLDPTSQRNAIGKYMFKAGSLFTILSVILIIVFNVVSGSILSALA